MTFRAPNPAGLCRGSPPRRWLLLGLLCSLPPAAGCTTDEPSPEQSAGADAAGDLGVAEGRDGQVPLPDGGDPLADGGREEAGQDAASGDLGGAASDAAADLARGDLAAPDLAVEADAALALDCSLAGDAGAAADLGPLPCPPPPLPLLTVNRIPATMNGSLPFTNLDHRLEPFLLLLPRAGFTLDLIGVPGEVQRLTMIHLGCAGRDWTLLAQEAADGWSVTAPADDPLAPGAAPVLCRALLRLPCPAMTLGADGAPAPEADAIGDGEELLELTLPVLIGELTPALDPFERPETWLVVHRRDHWTLQGLLAPDGSLQLLAQRVADGRADLDEALLLVGLASDDSAPGAALVEEDGARGASAIFRQRLLRHFLAELRALFDQPPDGTFHAGSVSVHFALQGEPDAPDPADFDPRGSFSMIGLGGGDPEERNAGRARLDWNNDEQDDDATDPDLGIFTTSMIAIFLDMELARMVLAPLAPLLGGTPLGQHPADAEIFAPGFDAALADGAAAQRAALLELATSLLGRGLAALAAHEIGHSLGLVPLGPPPGGLFGGEVNGEFAEGPFDGPHINTEGYNLMQQGYVLAGAGLELITAQPRFNELNMAYLRRRLIVDPAWPRQEPR